MSLSGYLPSSFLPYLPKSKDTLEPLDPADLLGHIALLRELYLPPIHGGFDVSDYAVVDDEEDDNDVSGLGLTNGHGDGSSSTARPSPIAGPSGLPTRDLEGGSPPLRIPPRKEGDAFDELDDFDDLNLDEGEDEGLEEIAEDDWDAHEDPFEREWAGKWLNGVIRRAQTCLENDGDETEGIDGEGSLWSKRELDAVLRDATAVLAIMAGTSAAGSLTRHLLFPLASALAPYARIVRSSLNTLTSLSPETTTFLAKLSISPNSPTTSTLRRLEASMSPIVSRRRSSTFQTNSERSSSTDSHSGLNRTSRARKRRAVLPVLLHDAPMADHLSVGVQTWGSSILLGRELSRHPARFGLFPSPSTPGKKMRVLELGAGTGLLSILCRKLLTLRDLALGKTDDTGHLVLATDFHPDVLANLKICVDLNFPPVIGVDAGRSGVDIEKLDWTTFPAMMARCHQSGAAQINGLNMQDELSPIFKQPFDLILASDCVYDPSHAELLRQVASWTLRLPGTDDPDDPGGVFHILSPLRPTFAPELRSVDETFPTAESSLLLKPGIVIGEGLAQSRALRLVSREEGKRSVKGRRGEGRVDEVQGYWWWEVGWHAP